jgi:hypothetical protein
MRLAVALLLTVPALALGDDKGWTDLLVGDKMDAFTGKPAGWVFVKGVKLDPANPRKLTFEPGSGILVNGETGIARDLYTKEKFGDVEVHIEFLIT